MLFNLPLEVLVLLIPVLIFSLCIHEFSHGYVAYLLGDNTAANAGRLTLNPLNHLDFMGSMMILFVGFGWAKPVPINPLNFKNKDKDIMKVAFAGPASNLILAFIGGMLIRYLRVSSFSLNENFSIAVELFLYINVALAVFNMIPIAPLDGSQIFGTILSKYNPNFAWKLQVYGPQVLLGLILFGIITGFSIIFMIMRPFIQFFVYLFSGMSI